jgi:hypothetical protein
MSEKRRPRERSSINSARPAQRRPVTFYDVVGQEGTQRYIEEVTEAAARQATTRRTMGTVAWYGVDLRRHRDGRLIGRQQ